MLRCSRVVSRDAPRVAPSTPRTASKLFGMLFWYAARSIKAWRIREDGPCSHHLIHTVKAALSSHLAQFSYRRCSPSAASSLSLPQFSSPCPALSLLAPSARADRWVGLLFLVDRLSRCLYGILLLSCWFGVSTSRLPPHTHTMMNKLICLAL